MPIRRKPLKAILGTVVLIVAAAIILFANQMPINQAFVEQQLSLFSGHIEREAERHNQKGGLTYDNVEIKGMPWARQAIVSNPAIELSDKAAFGSQAFKITTLRAEFGSEGVSSAAYHIDIPEPISILYAGQPVSSIQFSAVPRYIIDGATQKGSVVLNHSLKLPNSITITPAKAAAAAAPTIITFDENPMLVGKTVPGQAYGQESAFDMKNVKVIQGEEMLSIAGISGSFSQTQVEETKLKVDYKLNIEQVAYQKGKDSKPTMGFSADVVYQSDIPPQAPAPEKINSYYAEDVTINSATISTDAFKLTAKGRMQTAADDLLPFGQVDMVVEQFDKLRSSALLNAQARLIVDNIAQKVMGQPADAITNGNFMIKRDKNGTLMIGQVTFEQLAASIFADMMKQGGGEAAPQPMLEQAPPAIEGTALPPAAVDSPSPSSEAPPNSEQPVVSLPAPENVVPTAPAASN